MAPGSSRTTRIYGNDCELSTPARRLSEAGVTCALLQMKPRGRGHWQVTGRSAQRAASATWPHVGLEAACEGSMPNAGVQTCLLRNWSGKRRRRREGHELVVNNRCIREVGRGRRTGKGRGLHLGRVLLLPLSPFRLPHPCLSPFPVCGHCAPGARLPPPHLLHPPTSSRVWHAAAPS